MKWFLFIVIAWLVIWLGARWYFMSQPKEVPFIDFKHFNQPKTPNFVMIQNQTYAMSAASLKQTLEAIILNQPRTSLIKQNDQQMVFVTHSLLFGFPDVAYVHIEPRNQTHSQLSIYSHALYGYSDMGVNKKKVAAWIKQLNQQSNS